MKKNFMKKSIKPLKFQSFKVQNLIMSFIFGYLCEYGILKLRVLNSYIVMVISRILKLEV